ncbi:MAG: hypothetical protein PHX96_07285, partial [Candidatus Nanoarchaeia archaeon]|nr:hypothetical protein [Candidatus Nanoarchaeia archaeon]
MKNWVTFLLILVALIAIVFIFISISNLKDTGNNEIEDNLNTNKTEVGILGEEKPGTEVESLAGGGSGEDGGGSGRD